MRFPNFKKFSLLKRVPIREDNVTHLYSSKKTKKDSGTPSCPYRREDNRTYFRIPEF